MAKVPIHFIGFLGNLVDDSTTKLQLGEGFVIESGSPSDVMPFLRALYSIWGERGGRDIWPEGVFRVVKRNIAEFEATGRGGGVVADPTVCERAHTFVHDKLRLLRLFKEGNVVLAYSLLYHLNESQPTPFCPMKEYPIADRTPFTLTPEEVPKAQSFIEKYSLPLKEPSTQLAFRSFDLSYEIHDQALTLLSLMIAMEVLLHPGDRDELKYRICRNAGVLLGQDLSKGEAVYTEMRRLYDKRSALVHAGDQSSVARHDVLKLRQYVREAIKEAMNSRMSKDELLKTLNACGFGQRPWRKDAE